MEKFLASVAKFPLRNFDLTSSASGFVLHKMCRAVTWASLGNCPQQLEYKDQ